MATKRIVKMNAPPMLTVKAVHDRKDTTLHLLLQDSTRALAEIASAWTRTSVFPTVITGHNQAGTDPSGKGQLLPSQPVPYPHMIT